MSDAVPDAEGSRDRGHCHTNNGMAVRFIRSAWIIYRKKSERW